MTGYQRDIIRNNAGAIRYALDVDRLGNITLEAAKVLKVLTDLGEEQAKTALQTETDHALVIELDAAKKGKLVVSADPRKRSIMEWFKGDTGAVKITNVKETEFWFKVTTHFKVEGTRKFRNGGQTARLKSEVL